MSGAELKAWRAGLGISQAHAAELCKVRPKTWEGWEQGRKFPDHIELVLCEAARRHEVTK